jgi:hypothetical protein
MSLKWDSFSEESFKFELNSGCSTTTFAMDIHVAKPCLVHAGILLFSATQYCRYFTILCNSMFLIVCYLNAVEIFLYKEGTDTQG